MSSLKKENPQTAQGVFYYAGRKVAKLLFSMNSVSSHWRYCLPDHFYLCFLIHWICGGDSIICFCYTLLTGSVSSGQGVSFGIVVGFISCVFLLHPVPAPPMGLFKEHTHS